MHRRYNINKLGCHCRLFSAGQTICIIILSFYFFSYSKLNSQPIENESLQFSVNKSINTYKFRNVFVDYIPLSIGEFYINHNYSGTALFSNTKSIREEEEFLLNFNTPVYDKFNYSTNQNILYYTDSKTAENNELIRLSSTHGIKYSDKHITSQLLAGLESNKQYNISETGYLIEPSFNISNYSYEGYVVNTIFEGSLLQLKDNRKDNKLNLRAGINKQFNNQDNIGFYYVNDYHNRDILTLLRGIGTLDNSSPATENIFDNKNNLSLNLGFKIFENFNTSLNFNYGTIKAERFYRNGLEENPSTMTKKSYNEVYSGLNIATHYRTSMINQKTGVEFNLRSERNNISGSGEITPSDLSRQQEIEKQRDNNSNRTRIFSLTEIYLPYDYKLFFNYSASIYRYDTPSNKNNDDRDLSNFYILGGLEHKFSPVLTGGLAFKYDNSHIIFLKAARSGSNYQNNNLSLIPNVKINTRKLAMQPQFELLANYTIYDYESISSGIRSFSFRQISYRDSIYYKLSDNIGLYSQIVIKYYERGILFWDDFSETPELSSSENFIKLIAFFNEISNSFNGLNIGVGVRYYSLIQEGLRQGYYGNNFDRVSYGPETVIELRFKSGTELIFNGWYEYQYSNSKFIRGLPNFYLQTRVAI